MPLSCWMETKLKKGKKSSLRSRVLTEFTSNFKRCLLFILMHSVRPRDDFEWQWNWFQGPVDEMFRKLFDGSFNSNAIRELLILLFAQFNGKCMRFLLLLLYHTVSLLFDRFINATHYSTSVQFVCNLSQPSPIQWHIFILLKLGKRKKVLPSWLCHSLFPHSVPIIPISLLHKHTHPKYTYNRAYARTHTHTPQPNINSLKLPNSIERNLE